jgi:hypothetical protein
MEVNVEKPVVLIISRESFPVLIMKESNGEYGMFQLYG